MTGRIEIQHHICDIASDKVMTPTSQEFGDMNENSGPDYNNNNNSAANLNLREFE